MAQQEINVGTNPNDGTGDQLRDAFIKVNANDSEIYTAGPVGSNINITGNIISSSIGDIILSPGAGGNIVGNANVDLTADLAVAGATNLTTSLTVLGVSTLDTLVAQATTINGILTASVDTQLYTLTVTDAANIDSLVVNDTATVTGQAFAADPDGSNPQGLVTVHYLGTNDLTGMLKWVVSDGTTLADITEAEVLSFGSSDSNIISTLTDNTTATHLDLALASDVSIDNDLIVAGATSLGFTDTADLTVSGDIILAGNTGRVFEIRDAEVSGSIMFSVNSQTGDAGITGTLDVTGDTTLGVVSATDLTSSGTVIISGATENFTINDTSSTVFNVDTATGDTSIFGTLNVDGNVTIGTTFNVDATTGDTTLQGDLIIVSPTVPVSATDTGVPGQVAWDSGFFYVCTSANTWVRTALATW